LEGRRGKAEVLAGHFGNIMDIDNQPIKSYFNPLKGIKIASENY